MIFVVEESFSVACKGRTRRVITCVPESVTEENAVVNFKPQSQTIAWLSSYGYASSKTVWARASVRTWQTPLALHGALAATGDAPPFNGVINVLAIDDQYTTTLEATSPTGIPEEGTLMTIGMDVRRLKLGYWEVLVREIYSPGSSA